MFLFQQRVFWLDEDNKLLTWTWDLVTAAAILKRLPLAAFLPPLSYHTTYHFLDNEKGGEELYILSFKDLANFHT